MYTYLYLTLYTQYTYNIHYILDFGLSALVRIGEDGYHNSKSSRRKLYTGIYTIHIYIYITHSHILNIYITYILLHALYIIPICIHIYTYIYAGLHEPWGTAEYEAPELLNGAYGPQADMWAVGCMLYEMLSGMYIICCMYLISILTVYIH